LRQLSERVNAVTIVRSGMNEYAAVKSEEEGRETKVVDRIWMDEMGDLRFPCCQLTYVTNPTPPERQPHLARPPLTAALLRIHR